MNASSPPPGPLRILHVDMDAFFASVEQLDFPELRGRPVLVGHDGPRGVIAAASYESRRFGCRSAMPTAVARRLCPQAVIMPGRFDRYRQVSRQVFAILQSITPLVQPVSIDEAYLDVEGSVRLFGPPRQIAQRIKAQVREATGLTASVGVAPNKFLAKLASDMNKPDGLTVIGLEDVETLLAPMPVGAIWGIGPKTAARLEGIGVRTIAHLRSAPEALLKRLLSDEEIGHYRRLAHGIDDRVVTADRDARSIGHEQTFGHDLTDPEIVRGIILGQAEQVGARLRRHRLMARSVTVKIRYGDFETVTRRSTLPEPVDTTAPLWDTARGLFDAWAKGGFRPIRLIGVSAGQLGDVADQQMLFTDPARQRQQRLDGVVDRINDRFGKTTLGRAPTIARRKENE